jgi:hypothetical protein
MLPPEWSKGSIGDGPAVDKQRAIAFFGDDCRESCSDFQTGIQYTPGSSVFSPSIALTYERG